MNNAVIIRERADNNTQRIREKYGVKKKTTADNRL